MPAASMLVLPNRDVWTFEALDDKVDLEDSVFLAGNDGPRRTAQIVIRQDARQAASIRWSFVRSHGIAGGCHQRPPQRPAASRNCRCESAAADEPPLRPLLSRRRKLLTSRLLARLATLDGAPSGSADMICRAPGHKHPLTEDLAHD